MKIKKIIRRHILPTIIAATITTSAIYSNPIVANASSNDDISVAVNDEFQRYSDFFETKEEAENWLREKISELQSSYDIIDAKIYLYKGQNIETEIIPINELYDNEEDAIKRLNELNEDSNYNAGVKIEEVVKDVSVNDVIGINKEFESLEELNNYKEELLKKGNLNAVVELVDNGVYYGDEEVVKVITSTSTTDLERNVNNIIEDIQDNYNIKISTVKEEEIKPKNSNETIKETFISLEELNRFIKENNSNYSIDKIENRKELSHKKTTNINETFNSMTTLNNYKNELIKEGYTLSELNISTIKETTNTVKTDSIKINTNTDLKNKSEYKINGNYLIIKDNNNVVIWTNTLLNENEIASFKEEYSKITNLNNIDYIFISGTGNMNLYYINNNFSNYKIDYNNGIITLTKEDSSTDEISYGNYENILKQEEITKYNLTGKKTMPIYKDVYDLYYRSVINDVVQSYTTTIYKREKIRKYSYKLVGTQEIESKETKTYYNVVGEMFKTTRSDRYRAEIKYKVKTKDDTNTYEDITLNPLSYEINDDKKLIKRYF